MHSIGKKTGEDELGPDIFLLGNGSVTVFRLGDIELSDDPNRDVSPDGCHIAYLYSERMASRKVLEFIDLCDAFKRVK